MVSAAAGSVGSLVGQIGKIKGARVVGVRLLQLSMLVTALLVIWL